MIYSMLGKEKEQEREKKKERERERERPGQQRTKIFKETPVEDR